MGRRETGKCKIVQKRQLQFVDINCNCTRMRLSKMPFWMEPDHTLRCISFSLLCQYPHPRVRASFKLDLDNVSTFPLLRSIIARGCRYVPGMNRRTLGPKSRSWPRVQSALSTGQRYETFYQIIIYDLRLNVRMCDESGRTGRRISWHE